MELLNAIKVFIQLADISQSKGILTLEDAVIIKEAKETFVSELNKLETENHKKDGN